MRENVPSILIVEDERPIRNLLLAIFNQKYTCASASTLAEARNLLETNRFDLILADDRLPDGSGISLCESVSATNPRTLVLAMSGESDASSIAEAKRRGAYEYVCKPFSLREIDSTVTDALRHRAEAAA